MEFLMKKTLAYVIAISLLMMAMAGCSARFNRFKSIQNTAGEWRMFRNSLNGYYQRGVYGSGIDKLLWKGELKGRSYSSPVATESYVAVGALDSRLYFFDLDGGERTNLFNFKAPLSQSPYVSNKIIYAASGPGKNFLCGVNLITGKYVFKEKMFDISAPIIGDEKYIYCGDYRGTFNCFDKFTGKVIWDFQAQGPIMNAPAIVLDKVFVGSIDNHMYAFDADDGDLLWSYKVDGAINTAPAADTLVYFGSYDSNIYALRADNGSLVWKFETGGYVLSSPVIDDEHIYFGSNDRKVYCLNKFSGVLVWIYETEGVVNSTPLVLEDLVVVGSGDGMIYMLDKAYGELQYSHKTANMIKSSPIYFDGKIFVSSLDKHLYCFGH
jgi:eukaryotic-like serine/threonine-protein kinase